MKAVVTTGNGGLDHLVYRDVPRPEPRAGEALVEVLAAGVNNTDINARVGWYSASVAADTADAAAVTAEQDAATRRADGGWNGTTPWPLIQGTDACGRVAAIGLGVDRRLIGRRVLVRPNMRPAGFGSVENTWMGSDFDGAFAQYVSVPASEVFPVETGWTDVELGSVPCAFGTAENMLQRAGVTAGDHVLVTGASGGVGSAAVQLALLRGAHVTAVASNAKADQVLALGAERVVDRAEDVVAALGAQSVDVVIDSVAGPSFGGLVETLRPGGRYASSGAIAGPIVTFDKRLLYLRDLTFFGATAWAEPVFPTLIGYIERGRLRPTVAASFPLERIADAQRAFLDKQHVGKLVLVPPPG